MAVTTYRNKMNAPNGVCQLDGAITSGAATATIKSGHTITATANFTLTFGSEIILCQRSGLTLTLTTRGYAGSTAAGHADKTYGYNYQIAQDLTDLEAAILALENAREVSATLSYFTAATALTLGGTSGSLTVRNPTLSMNNGSSTSYTLSAAARLYFNSAYNASVGASNIIFDPLDSANTHDCQVQFFRGTNTSGPCDLLLFKGDNTSTPIHKFVVGAAPAVYFQNGSGTPIFSFDCSGANLTCAADITMGDAKNIVVNATTGTKIGTAASQKLGFFNATPVVQQTKAGHNNWAAVSDVVAALVSLGFFDAA